MSRSNLFYDNCFPSSESQITGALDNTKISSRQSLKGKFDRECVQKRNSISAERMSQVSRTGGSWCDALSLSKSSVNPKLAWKNGAEKLSQTFNNVRTTFGTLSQKIKKSTKRRQPLVNVDSPKTPVTPYTRSKAVLGRTPTKLYSPFRIDTPTGKENCLERPIRLHSGNQNMRKKKLSKIISEPQFCVNISYSPERKLPNDLLQTQIGIYEFQAVANKIVQNNSVN